MHTILSKKRSHALDAIGPAIKQAPLMVLYTLCTWQERARERRMLRELDSRLRKDIGVSLADVEQECSKPFWKR